MEKEEVGGARSTHKSDEKCVGIGSPGISGRIGRLRFLNGLILHTGIGW
jgi:hypothetical protein